MFNLRLQPVPQECRADLDAVMRNTGTCDSCCGCSTAAASAFSNMLWINGHIFTLFLTCICHKRQHETFWKPGHILDEYVRASRMVAPVYPFVTPTAYPCKTRKGLHHASFPKGLKSLIIPVGWILLAKDKETPRKKARCAKADFPSQAVADWRWPAQHSTRGFTKIRGNIGEHAADYGETGRATAGGSFAHGNKTSCFFLPLFFFFNLVIPKFF